MTTGNTVGLPATGVLSYNDYVFEGASTVRVATEMVYDGAERVIIAHKHIITVETVIQNEATGNNNDLDDDYRNIRHRLGQAGKPFTFTGRGFGNDIKIARNSQLQDIDGGPKPRILAWEPIGDDKAAAVIWVIEVTIPPCPVKGVRVSSINYQVRYSIDGHGDNTRRVNGYIEIARKAGARQRTVEQFKNRFKIHPLKGFRRTQDWGTSADKRRVVFSVTDTQIASRNAYPEFITAIEASHRVSWTRGRDRAANHFAVISATITPEAHQSGALAWLVFARIVRSRILRVSQPDKGLFLDSLEAEEDIYGRTHSFSAKYRYLSNITDLLKDSGLWTPVPGDWNAWSTSLQDTAYNTYGNLGLVDNGIQDTVVTLCDSQTGQLGKPLEEIPFMPSAGSAPPQEWFKNIKPKPPDSYRKYKTKITETRDDPVQAHEPIQAAPDNKDAGAIDVNDGDNAPGSVPPGFQQPPAIEETIIQEAGAAAHRLILEWDIERLGHQISRKVIKSVSGKKVTEESAVVVNEVVGEYFGQLLYRSRGRTIYRLTKAAGPQSPPTNLREPIAGDDVA